MAMIPVLFIVGVLFGYFLVLPAAVRFLQNFNSDQFNILLQARDYYKFAVLTLAAIGDRVPAPGGDPRAHAAGRRHPQFLTRNWRYAIVILTVIAVLLPGHRPGLDDDRSASRCTCCTRSASCSARFVKPVVDDAEEPADLLD